MLAISGFVPVRVAEAKRADLIWSEGDFLALCEHMLNENPPNHFLRVWIDKASGQPRFAKAPVRSRADKHAGWTWNTITGKANVQTSIGFYPSNAEGKSRWAAIDFDAHNGEQEQARKWSLEAFSFLLQHPAPQPLPYSFRVRQRLPLAHHHARILSCRPVDRASENGVRVDRS